jgi:hypothetical protein
MVPGSKPQGGVMLTDSCLCGVEDAVFFRAQRQILMSHYVNMDLDLM